MRIQSIVRARILVFAVTAQEFSKFRCEYTDEARERRRIAMSRIAANPTLAQPFAIALRGPDGFPEETNSPSVWRRLYEWLSSGPTMPAPGLGCVETPGERRRKDVSVVE